MTFSDLGHKVVLVSNNLAETHHAWWAYDAAVKVYRDHKGQHQPWSLEKAIQTLDPVVDIWHIHNEPDWPVWVARTHTKRPIIYDIHDLRSDREGMIDEHEAKALEACDGVSTVSRRYQQKILERTQKPVAEVLSCVPLGWMPQEKPKVYRGGIVYEGGLGSVGKEFPCRRWADVFQEILEQGTQVWAYRGNPDADPSEFPGVMLRGPMEYVHLIRELSTHEFGLVGSPSPDPMFDGALPNKLFEYIAAGIPMICLNAPDVSQFLLATGFGVTVNDVKEIPEAMEHMREGKYRARVWRNRKYWTAEAQMPTLSKLYDDVLNKCSA